MKHKKCDAWLINLKQGWVCDCFFNDSTAHRRQAQPRECVDVDMYARQHFQKGRRSCTFPNTGQVRLYHNIQQLHSQDSWRFTRGHYQVNMFAQACNRNYHSFSHRWWFLLWSDLQIFLTCGFMYWNDRKGWNFTGSVQMCKTQTLTKKVLTIPLHV